MRRWSRIRAELKELLHPGSPRGSRGQDLIEYALMVGFLVVGAAAFIPYTVTGPMAHIFNKIHYFLITLGNG